MRDYRVPQQTSSDEPIMFNFTAKESVIMLIFGAVAYICVFSLKGFLELRIILAVLCVLVGFGLAKVKPWGKGLDEWVFIMAAFNIRPKKRVWRKIREINLSQKRSFLDKILRVPFRNNKQIEIEAEVEIDDVGEQIKGIIKSKFFWEWKEMIVKNPNLERASEEELLTILEQFLNKKEEVKND
ncbi:PrgI family protein [Candidatus Oleimmundimicrobium sp.]|uniref:PrgI family protein n=1 Tax=Candidatus Oleimmundimicrobium sp. TaxID=3060597 RepID=UPI00271F5A89|nr:PrgI family protein [Candidatus Oleimmundimicrobium sp.]MDO8886681.1 PrgI family protein [Candidatus Oleimmundimicrobium sp.]